MEITYVVIIMKELFIALVSVVFISGLFLTSNVNADGGQWRLLTPRMILRTNVTTGKVSFVNGSIGVGNTDAHPVNVSLMPQGDIKDIITLEEINFTLVPNETKWINFSVGIKKPGTYNGMVIVSFEREGAIPSGLASEIIIIANENKSQTIGNMISKEKLFLVFSLAFITLAIIIAKVRRQNKK
jgi:hypothetical protein